MDRSQRVIPYLYLATSTALWGGSFVAGRFVVQEAQPLVVASLRFLLASAVLLALVVWREKRLPRPGGRDVLYFLGLGLTGIAIYNILFFYGLTWATASESSLIIATGPVVTSLLGILLLGERATAAKAMGIIVSILGVAVVVLGSLTAAGQAAPSSAWVGDLMQFGAVISWAIYSLLGKKVMHRYSALVSTAYGSLAGAAILAPLALALVPWRSTLRMGPAGWGAVTYLALFGTVLGFVFWYEGLRRVELSRGSVMLNAVPFWAAVLSAALLGERLGWKEVIGAALVVAGVLMATGIWVPGVLKGKRIAAAVPSGEARDQTT